LSKENTHILPQIFHIFILKNATILLYNVYIHSERKTVLMKKAIKMIVVFALAISMVCSNATAFEFTNSTIKDIDRHWAEDSIQTLKSLGVMNGYDGYSNPDAIVTRGEFAALLTRAFAITSATETISFSDIDSSHIFYVSINAAHSAGIIDGFPDKTFRPENMVTREEIVLMLSRLTPTKDNYDAPEFTDIDSEYKYTKALAKIVADGIVGGYPDGSFRPYEQTTRAEAASMIVGAMKKYLKASTEKKDVETAEKYLEALFSNTHTNVCGSALNDAQYIKYTHDKAESYGYTVKNSINNISFDSYEQYGPFSEFIVSYSVTSSVNDAKKKYNGKSEMKLICRDGVSAVYEHNRYIVKDEPVNLTWEVYSEPPTYATPGVNVVSPTCFRVEDTEDKKATVTDTITPENGQTLYFNSSLTEEYVAYAKKNKYEIWAMYKTDFKPETASLLLNSRNARKQSADYLLKHMLTHSLDGINFDFENMSYDESGAYSNHVKEITLMAHTIGATTSVDVNKFEPTSLMWSMCYDRDRLAKTVDYVALMAYDQFYSGSSVAGPVAGLGWTENTITQTLEEVPAEKLLLGIPYYVRCWKLKDGKVVSSEAISMSKALSYISDNDAEGVYDSKYGLTKYMWRDKKELEKEKAAEKAKAEEEAKAKAENDATASSDASEKTDSSSNSDASVEETKKDDTKKLTEAKNKSKTTKTEYVLWLENANSIKSRIKLAKKYSLAGVASWRRGFETADVWKVIQDELN